MKTMNKNLLPPFIGVFVSWLVIWQLHSYFLVDNCLDKGGTFDYKIGQCLVDNINIQNSGLSSAMLIVYFVLGLTVALIVATFVRKFISKRYDKK